MRVQLRYFASIREALGRRAETVDVPEGATVESVWEQLVAQHPALRQQRYRPAVNQEYVTPAATLRDGDELVFIPPVSGGGRRTKDEFVGPPSFVFRHSGARTRERTRST